MRNGQNKMGKRPADVRVTCDSCGRVRLYPPSCSQVLKFHNGEYLCNRCAAEPYRVKYPTVRAVGGATTPMFRQQNK